MKDYDVILLEDIFGQSGMEFPERVETKIGLLPLVIDYVIGQEGRRLESFFSELTGRRGVSDVTTDHPNNSVIVTWKDGAVAHYRPMVGENGRIVFDLLAE